MKTSLFKKEIAKKEAGYLYGGDGTTYQRPTIGPIPTARYVVPWGVVRDTRYGTEWENVPDPVQ